MDKILRAFLGQNADKNGTYNLNLQIKVNNKNAKIETTEELLLNLLKNVFEWQSDYWSHMENDDFSLDNAEQFVNIINYFDFHLDEDWKHDCLENMICKAKNMINEAEAKALEDSLCNFDNNIQKCLNTIDQLPTGQLLTTVPEGRVSYNIEEPKDSTVHFGKLLEEFILTKYTNKINTTLNDDMESFSVRERDLIDSRFLIIKYNDELHVRSIVFGPSEQMTPRTHYERLGLRFFKIIANHIEINSISEKEPFDLISRQFTYIYDGPTKKRPYIREFTPRVVEVDPTIEYNHDEQNRSKSTTKKIPKVIINQIREIHRKDIDIDLTRMNSNTQLWTRIQDIAYGSEFYDQQILVELGEIIQSVPWNYENPDSEELQEKWDDMIKTLNSL